jgi:iron complex transport system substrate-binding protein
MRRWSGRARAAGLALVACSCACGYSGDGPEDRLSVPGAIRLTDAAGLELALPAPARRVVSLVPSATETLHAMGRGDVLVGRTDFDTHAWAETIPSVGGGLQPNLEAIVVLEPDLVVRFAGAQDARTPARLQELGIPVLAVRPDRIEDIFRTLVLLGDAIGDRPAADALARELRGGLSEAAAATRGLPRVRVAYVLGGTPPWVAGPGTYIDEVMSLMGGVNAFADLGRLYAAVSREELHTRAIDVVLVAEESGFDAGLVAGARLERIGGALETPGPRLVEAAYLVGEVMHRRKLK